MHGIMKLKKKKNKKLQFAEALCFLPILYNIVVLDRYVATP